MEQWGSTLVEGAKTNGKNPYRKNGRSIERITENLAEDGFLPRDEHGKPVVGALEDALSRSMSGEDVLSTTVTDQGLHRRALAVEAEAQRRNMPEPPLTISSSTKRKRRLTPVTCDAWNDA